MASTPLNRPLVYLKFASSIDGCLEDTSNTRHIFSSPEDAAEVQELRSQVDAILVGAETLRRDNPLLTIRVPELIQSRLGRGQKSEPLRVALTASGVIAPEAKIFHQGTGDRIIYTTEAAASKLRKLPATIIEAGSEEVDLEFVLDDLKAKGVNSLLVEGGPKVIANFFNAGLFDLVRMAIAPEVLGEEKAPRVKLSSGGKELKLVRARELGGMTVLEYSR